MLDFSIGELGLIGAVALVVLGPEKLPKVARQVGAWMGKAQRYVNQVKADINREMELSELKRLQDEARSAAMSVESSVRDAVGGLESSLDSASATVSGALAGTSDEAQFASTGSTAPSFTRRYRPGPSIDELSDEVARLKRRLAMPQAGQPTARGKYAVRARLNRPRIRR